MKNPIGKFRREELRKIRLEIESFKEKFNLLSEILQDILSIRNDLTLFMDSMKPIIEMFQEEEPEPTEEEMLQAQQEQMKMFEEIMKAAIMNILNKKENQEAIMQFVAQFRAGPSAFEGQGFDMSQMLNNEGDLDPLKALITYFFNKPKGVGKFPGAGTISTPTESRGGY